MKTCLQTLRFTKRADFETSQGISEEMMEEYGGAGGKEGEEGGEAHQDLLILRSRGVPTRVRENVGELESGAYPTATPKQDYLRLSFVHQGGVLSGLLEPRGVRVYVVKE